jgi:hypothetical protein
MRKGINPINEITISITKIMAVKRPTWIRSFPPMRVAFLDSIIPPVRRYHAHFTFVNGFMLASSNSNVYALLPFLVLLTINSSRKAAPFSGCTYAL